MKYAVVLLLALAAASAPAQAQRGGGVAAAPGPADPFSEVERNQTVERTPIYTLTGAGGGDALAPAPSVGMGPIEYATGAGPRTTPAPGKKHCSKGCTKCNTATGKCSQCAPLKRNKAGRTTALPYALVSGKCVACKPTGAHASSCQACNGKAPARCTKCLPVDAAKKKPLYASKHGVCTSCPTAHCATCNSAGRCTKCTKGKKMRKGGKCA